MKSQICEHCNKEKISQSEMDMMIGATRCKYELTQKYWCLYIQQYIKNRYINVKWRIMRKFNLGIFK